VTDLDTLAQEALAAVAAADDLEGLDEVRVRYTGKRSALTGLQKAMRDLDTEERRRRGQALNAFRTTFQVAFEARREALGSAALAARLEAERVDLTLPPRRLPPGRPHLLTQVEQEIVDVFVGMGYQVAEGPEAEAGSYNFDLLNIEPDHPARQEMDTIYVDGFDDVVLRTHTSPVQARVMTRQPPPIAVVCPGRTYRADAVDATHSPVFSQVEGLVVDEGITMGDLRGTLLAFSRACSATNGASACGRRSSPSRNPPRRSTSPSRAPPATTGGWRSSVPGWSTRTCSPPAGSTRSATPGSRSGSASSASRCCATASRTSVTSTRRTPASSRGSDPSLSSRRSVVKLPLSWLTAMVDVDLPVEELVDVMSLNGLEVEAVTFPGAGAEGIRTARVLHWEPHPDADKLRVVRVTGDGGDGEIELVCGAANFDVGDVVAHALPGGHVPGVTGPDGGKGLTLSSRRIRGVTSHGMLASARELELGEDHAGILVLPVDTPLGTSLTDLLPIGEPVIEVAVQADRGDHLSVLGVARDLAAILDTTWRAPDVPAPVAGSTIPVDIATTGANASSPGRSRTSRSSRPRCGCRNGSCSAACARSTWSST
jgi:phenylalanyl-tRNA synthetase alpha subunit/tRNA-binding EMAP/Myf-like protein